MATSDDLLASFTGNRVVSNCVPQLEFSRRRQPLAVSALFVEDLFFLDPLSRLKTRTVPVVSPLDCLLEREF